MKKVTLSLLSSLLILSSHLSAQLPSVTLQHLLGQEAALVPQIMGTDTVCEGTTSLYLAKNYGSDDSLEWTAIGNVHIESTDGDAIRLNFYQPGRVDLTLNRYSIWGDGRQTIEILVLPAPHPKLGKDTIICPGESLALTANASFAAFRSAEDAKPTYRWQDGSAEDQLTADQSGTYWVVAQDRYGCKGQDIVNVTVAQTPQPDLGKDRHTCTNEPVTLSPGSFSTYQWQNGSNSSSFIAKKPGKYWVEVTDQCGQKGIDSLTITAWKTAKINLGKDLFTCEGDTLVLDAGKGFQQYLWGNGSRQQTISVTETGTYWVSALDKAGCEITDSVYFEVEPCVSELSIPAAFSPNGDGLNDTFRPKKPAGLKNFSIQIFDASGLMVYLSDKKNAAWDGKFEKSQLPAGPYTYTVQYVDGAGKQTFDAGTVQLKR